MYVLGVQVLISPALFSAQRLDVLSSRPFTTPSRPPCPLHIAYMHDPPCPPPPCPLRSAEVAAAQAVIGATTVPCILNTLLPSSQC